jgi:dienelactone hydrolase
MRRSISYAGTVLVVAVLALLQFLATPARAADNPFQRGPDPTSASVNATSGPFATSQTTVSRFSVIGFGGGTIYFPTSTAEGTFGAVAVAPGFTATQSSIAWLGPRIASQGFVVFTIDTISTFDQPDARGDELLAALDYLTTRSTVRTRIDASRLAVMGHSMGGGGTLEASRDRPSLQAAVGLTPWDLTKNWSGNQVPTMLVGAELDTVAPPAEHAIPFFNSLPAAPEKAYVELTGATHFAPNSPNTTIARYSISWLKEFVDNDDRYEQFLCGAGAGTEAAVDDYRTTCPLTN